MVKLEEESDSNGFVNALPMLHSRIMPGIAKGSPDRLNELIVSSSARFEAGQAYRGTATLELFPSPSEELAQLGIEEYIGGYFRQVGAVWDGGSEIEQPLSQASRRA